ncbi:MAG: hypothetical protein B5M51_06460 [Anaerolinea sp. 4484_236]|nr:MAG: hypothetical protein B5M51_06460 [Anaerolinea sp. 4484_236]
MEKVCAEIIEENPSQVEQYQNGKKMVLGWLIGQVMGKTRGKADPQAVRAMLQKLLSD